MSQEVFLFIAKFFFLQFGRVQPYVQQCKQEVVPEIEPFWVQTFLFVSLEISKETAHSVGKFLESSNLCRARRHRGDGCRNHSCKQHFTRLLSTFYVEKSHQPMS